MQRHDRNVNTLINHAQNVYFLATENIYFSYRKVWLLALFAYRKNTHMFDKHTFKKSNSDIFRSAQLIYDLEGLDVI